MALGCKFSINVSYNNMTKWGMSQRWMHATTAFAAYATYVHCINRQAYFFLLFVCLPRPMLYVIVVRLYAIKSKMNKACCCHKNKQNSSKNKPTSDCVGAAFLCLIKIKQLPVVMHCILHRVNINRKFQFAFLFHVSNIFIQICYATLNKNSWKIQLNRYANESRDMTISNLFSSIKFCKFNLVF